MTKRLQVLLDDQELAQVQEAAQRDQMTTADWVRRSLRGWLDQDRPSSAADKLEAIAVAARYSFPVADIDQMLAEIESGYLAHDKTRRT